MSGNLWRAEIEFTVCRRIPWDNDEGLRPHIDSVVDALREHEVTAEIEVAADLESPTMKETAAWLTRRGHVVP